MEIAAYSANGPLNRKQSHNFIDKTAHAFFFFLNIFQRVSAFLICISGSKNDPQINIKTIVRQWDWDFTYEYLIVN